MGLTKWRIYSAEVTRDTTHFYTIRLFNMFGTQITETHTCTRNEVEDTLKECKEIEPSFQYTWKTENKGATHA